MRTLPRQGPRRAPTSVAIDDALQCDETPLLQSAPEGETKLANLSGIVEQLKRERDRVQQQLSGLNAALAAFAGVYNGTGAPRRKMSAKGRARIAAAQRARWAKGKGSKEYRGCEWLQARQTHNVGIGSSQDCSGTEIEVGQGEGEEGSLVGFRLLVICVSDPTDRFRHANSSILTVAIFRL